MEDLQATLQSILSDPEQMARVAAVAESLGLKPPDGAPPLREDVPSLPGPEPDSPAPLELMGQLAALGGSEARLLNALRPGLSPAGQKRIDRALRAARLSRLAGQLLKTREGGHV